MIGDDMKIVFGLDGDEEIPVVAVTPPGGDAAQQVKATVGVGNRYYVFSSIPFDFSNGIVVNFSEAAECVNNNVTNLNNIIAMLETPPLNMISEI